MSRKKDHFVEVVMNGHRYVATEEAGKIFLKRDGDSIGKALWENDQMVNCTTTALPDDAFLALERKLRERFNANWDED